MHIYLHIYEKSSTFAACFLVLYIEKKFIINIFACGGNYLLWRCGYALTGNVKFIYKYTGSGIDALTRQSELTTQVFLIFLLFLDIFVSASAFFFTNKTTINMKTIITRAIAAQKRLFVLFVTAVMTISLSAQGHPGGQHQHQPQPQHQHQPQPQPQHHHQQQPQQHHQPKTISPEQMRKVMETLRKQDFDEKKLEVAKLAVTLCPFTTEDLARVATLFTFDDQRLEFLEYAYYYCADQENYFRLRRSFKFETSFDELMEHLYPNQRRR